MLEPISQRQLLDHGCATIRKPFQLEHTLDQTLRHDPKAQSQPRKQRLGERTQIGHAFGAVERGQSDRRRLIEAKLAVVVVLEQDGVVALGAGVSVSVAVGVGVTLGAAVWVAVPVGVALAALVALGVAVGCGTAPPSKRA